MIDIRYFLARQNAARNGISEPPSQPAASPQAPVRNTKISRAGERVVLDLVGPEIEPLTTVEEDSYCVMKGNIPPGVSVPLHSHADPESFYVVSGEGQFLVEDNGNRDWRTVRQGDFVQIHGNAKHAWRNLSDRPMEALITTTPRLGKALREMGVTGNGHERPLPTREDIERLAQITERYGYWMASPDENAAVGISLVAAA